MVLFHGMAILVNYVLLFALIPPIIFFLEDKWNPFWSYITQPLYEWIEKVMIKLKLKELFEESEVKEQVDKSEEIDQYDD
jgi:hypothetical protein